MDEHKGAGGNSPAVRKDRSATYLPCQPFCSWFISNIVEIGFARPSADGRLGHRIRLARRRLACACISSLQPSNVVFSRLSYTVGVVLLGEGGLTNERTCGRADVFTVCLLPTDLLSLASVMARVVTRQISNDGSSICMSGSTQSAHKTPRTRLC